MVVLLLFHNKKSEQSFDFIVKRKKYTYTAENIMVLRMIIPFYDKSLVMRKTCLMPYANNKVAAQPAHRCLDSITHLVVISEISRL